MARKLRPRLWTCNASEWWRPSADVCDAEHQALELPGAWQQAEDNPKRSGGASARCRSQLAPLWYDGAMAPTPDENTCPPSTRWTWKKVMVSPPPTGRKQQPPKASASPALPARNPREPLTITVVYRGGSEAWYEIKARGRTYRRPGYLAIHDVFKDIVGWQAEKHGPR